MIYISSPDIGQEEIDAVRAVMESGMLAQGEEVSLFEKAFAKYIGTKHAIATSSGTTALEAALIGLGSRGDVLIPSFSFVATANTILHTNSRPKFVDIDERTFNIDPKKLERSITTETKGIMPVHLYGQPAAMDEIMEMAESHGLFVVEDACQAHGAEYKGRKAGSIGDVGCFSLYATKNMMTGEGGIITTNNDELAQKIRHIINHGQSRRYYHYRDGHNWRMTNISAAIGRVQLRKLDAMNEKRIQNAEYLSESLNSKIEVPFIGPDVKHVFHQYTVKIKNRDNMIEKMNKAGIHPGIYYPIPIHKQELYKNMGYLDNLPVTESLSEQVLSLPVHPKLSKADLDTIIDQF